MGCHSAQVFLLHPGSGFGVKPTALTTPTPKAGIDRVDHKVAQARVLGMLVN